MNYTDYMNIMQRFGIDYPEWKFVLLFNVDGKPFALYIVPRYENQTMEKANALQNLVKLEMVKNAVYCMVTVKTYKAIIC